MAASRGGRFVYVANANSDTVSVIDTATDKSRRNHRLPAGRPAAVRQRLATPWPSAPTARTLYVANGTNNCVAVVRLGRLARRDRRAGRSTAASPA